MRTLPNPVGRRVLRLLVWTPAVFALLACRRSPPPDAHAPDAEIALPPTPQAAPELATRKLCEHACEGDARECRAVALDEAVKERCAQALAGCKARCRQ